MYFYSKQQRFRLIMAYLLHYDVCPSPALHALLQRNLQPTRLRSYQNFSPASVGIQRRRCCIVHLDHWHRPLNRLLGRFVASPIVVGKCRVSRLPVHVHHRPRVALTAAVHFAYAWARPPLVGLGVGCRYHHPLRDSSRITD